MTTLNEVIEVIRAENPNGIRVGSDEVGYTDLTAAQYEAQIQEWALARLAKLQKNVELEAQAAQKTALLEKLGITEDEAKLLLG
jgi:hypothetical protein